MPQNCLNNSSVCCFILGRDKQTGGNTPVAATADRTAVGQTDGTLKTSRCFVRLTLQEMFWIFFSFLKLAPDIIFDSLITGLLALPKNQLKRLPFRLYSRSKMHLKFESFFFLKLSPLAAAFLPPQSHNRKDRSQQPSVQRLR